MKTPLSKPLHRALAHPSSGSQESIPLRHQRLGDHVSLFIADNVTYPVAVTMQPNFGWMESGGSQRVRELTKAVFYCLDHLHTGCPRPEFLSPSDRLNGLVVNMV